MAGNAKVTLFDGYKNVVFDVWLSQFSTSTQNEFNSQQVKNGIQWLPIRRAEMFVNFAAQWPLVGTGNYNNSLTLKAGYEDMDPADGFGKMNRFQDAVRKHQLAIVNGSTSQPMILNYINNSDASSSIFNELISTKPLKPLVYNGWIQTVEKNYIKFQNVYMTTYNMNVLNSNLSHTLPTHLQGANGDRSSITYAPTASTQGKYGANWVNTNLLAQGSNLIQGIPS